MNYDAVPTEIAGKIDQKLMSAGESWRAGDLAKAEEDSLEAWALIPEPKFKWDYYPQIISRGMVIWMRNTRQFEKAKQWLAMMRQAYEPQTEASEDSIRLLEGTVLFESGDLDGAFERFDTLFKKYRGAYFQGEDKKYLEFYLNRKKANATR